LLTELSLSRYPSLQDGRKADAQGARACGVRGLALASPRHYKPGFAPFPTPLEAWRARKRTYDMAAIKQLAAVTRSGIGKGAARSVRREGRVPGVVYGGGEAAEPISVDFKELNKFIYSGQFLTSIFEIDIEGRKQRVLPRDYQLDKVTDTPMHVDFFRLKAGTRVRIAVPVKVINREASPGLKKGGAVNLVLHSVELVVPAEAIPESIIVDLTGMDFHDSVHVTALKLPEGCKPADTRIDYTVVTVVPPTIYTEEAPVAAAATTAAAPGAAAPGAEGAPAAAAGTAAPAAGAAAAAPAKGAAAAPAKGAGKK
jgi:large subunit ribosomal protein L25